MIRATGTWTTFRGEPRRVAGRADLDEIWLGVPGSSGAVEKVPSAEVGDIVKVMTTARWRGGKVMVGDVVEGGGRGFHTNDAELASRESLYGDQYSGWRGVADAAELTEVHEDLKVLRRSGGPAA